MMGRFGKAASKLGHSLLQLLAIMLVLLTGVLQARRGFVVSVQALRAFGTAQEPTIPLLLREAYQPGSARMRCSVHRLMYRPTTLRSKAVQRLPHRPRLARRLGMG